MHPTSSENSYRTDNVMHISGMPVYVTSMRTHAPTFGSIAQNGTVRKQYGALITGSFNIRAASISFTKATTKVSALHERWAGTYLPLAWFLVTMESTNDIVLL